MPLFEPERLAVFAMERASEITRSLPLSGATNRLTTETNRRLAVIETLRQRREAGVLTALSETKIEQSFNERVFSDVFDYPTMFGTKADFHLVPKNHYQASGRKDDFALGYWNGTAFVPVVLVELKGAGVDLEKAQGSEYDYLSPINQAFRAAKGSAVRWIVVSNFDEMRLFRSSDCSRCEIVRFDELDSPVAFWRAYALFGRSNLLGTPGELGALERFFNGGGPMIVDRQDRFLRLTHKARFSPEPPQEPFLSHLHLLLKSSLEAGASWAARFPAPSLDAGRVASTFVPDEKRGIVHHGRLELTQGGFLHASETIGRFDNVEAAEIVRSMTSFILMAKHTMKTVFGDGGPFFSWELLDLPEAFSVSNSSVTRLAPRSRVPERSLLLHEMNSKTVSAFVLGALEELLYPLRAGGGGRCPIPEGLEAIVLELMEKQA